MASIEERKPCKGCGKSTRGFAAKGMGPCVRKLNKKVIEDDRVWLCPNCLELLE